MSLNEVTCFNTDMCSKKVTGQVQGTWWMESWKKTIFNLVDPINLESLWIFTNNSVWWKIDRRDEIYTKDEHHIIKLLLQEYQCLLQCPWPHNYIWN